MKPGTFVIISLVVLLMLACNLASIPGAKPSSATPAGIKGGTRDPNPVSLNDGLASLNSYSMTVQFKSIGPDPAKSSTTSIQRQRSNDTNASLTDINMTAINAAGEDPSITNSSIYQIGNDQCSGNEADGWSWSSSTPAQAEMQGLITGMIGLTPLIDHPVFVAAETVNGIPTNHFSFQVSGLGASSGSVVNINQGDYWLAVDGQYIVKYVLTVETSQAAQSEVLHEEVSIEMTQINQPVSIAFPQGCLDASLVTPTP
jgi:hypothetical protein